jgi:anti-sigma regulatory factor (Ser/Thr protein kinase)
VTLTNDHIVTFYDDDAKLVSEIAAYFGDALASDEAVIAIATPDHRASFERVLIEAGIDVADDRYVALDARETLASFMTGRSPDRKRFRSSVGSLVADATASGRPLRAFGEMVALLYSEGNASAAIQLERLWNELASEVGFTLHCAYPRSSFMTDADLKDATRICEEHSSLVDHAYPESGGTATPNVSHVFVPSPLAITAARRLVSETLTAWGELSVVTDAALVVSELATNAVIHAASAFGVAISRDDENVRITVRDVDAQPPVSTLREPETIGGLGLVIVEELTTRWGSEALPDGKAVWCDFVRRD